MPFLSFELNFWTLLGGLWAVAFFLYRMGRYTQRIELLIQMQGERISAVEVSHTKLEDKFDDFAVSRPCQRERRTSAH